MTAAFLTALVVGVLGLLSTLVASHFIVGRSGDGPPFGLLAKEAGLVAAGAGGLISTWAGLDSLGSGVVAIVSLALLMLAIYTVALPYLRRRSERRARTGYVGLGGTVTRDVLPGDVGEVLFVNSEGTRVRMPARSGEAEALPQSTRVYITAVDDEFVHVTSAREI